MMIDDLPYRQVGEPKPGGIVCVVDHATNFVPEDIEKGFQAITDFTDCIDPEEEYNSGKPSPSLKQVMDKMSKL